MIRKAIIRYDATYEQALEAARKERCGSFEWRGEEYPTFLDPEIVERDSQSVIERLVFLV